MRHHLESSTTALTAAHALPAFTTAPVAGLVAMLVVVTAGIVMTRGK